MWNFTPLRIVYMRAVGRKKAFKRISEGQKGLKMLFHTVLTHKIHVRKKEQSS